MCQAIRGLLVTSYVQRSHCKYVVDELVVYDSCRRSLHLSNIGLCVKHPQAECIICTSHWIGTVPRSLLPSSKSGQDLLITKGWSSHRVCICMFIINRVITAVYTVHTLYTSTTIIGEHYHACASSDQHKAYITVVYASLLINHFSVHTFIHTLFNVWAC